MKMSFLKLQLIAIGLVMAIAVAYSQGQHGDEPYPKTLEKVESRPLGRPDGRGPRPFHPLEFALDANNDGYLDSEEIQEAVASLQMLDLNGDGKLSGVEFRPAHPPHVMMRMRREGRLDSPFGEEREGDARESDNPFDQDW